MSTKPNDMPHQILKREKINQWILELLYPETRENAMKELCKINEVVPDLAILLWNSFGTTAILLLEIVSIYDVMSPATLTENQSKRVCNALTLMKNLACHPEARSEILKAQIPLYLIPFLKCTNSKSYPYEILRLSSLRVLEALVRNEDKEVIKVLLSSEIVKLCLEIMAKDSTTLKAVAAFIVYKVLKDDEGLSFVCETYERFYELAVVLHNTVIRISKMLENGVEEMHADTLIKLVVRCYLHLSDNARAKEALRLTLPQQLRDGTFVSFLKDELSSQNRIDKLLKKLDNSSNGMPFDQSQQ